MQTKTTLGCREGPRAKVPDHHLALNLMAQQFHDPASSSIFALNALCEAGTGTAPRAVVGA